MADEPGFPSDGGRQAPDFLTVDQTADVLQIGRSTTYELVGRFVRSAGTDGIPAILVGGQYRIPRARLEEYAGRSITWPPPPRTRKHRPHRSSRKGASPTAEPAPQAPDQSDELRAPGGGGGVAGRVAGEGWWCTARARCHGEPPWDPWRLLTLETRMESCHMRCRLGSQRRVATARLRRIERCGRCVSSARNSAPITER